MKKKMFVLMLGLIAVVALAPGKGQSQQKSERTPPGTATLPTDTESRDPGPLFDQISRGKGYISGEDISSYESFRETFQAFSQATNFTSPQMTKEQYLIFLEWRQIQRSAGNGRGRPIGKLPGAPGTTTQGSGLTDLAGGAPPTQGSDQAGASGTNPAVPVGQDDAAARRNGKRNLQPPPVTQLPPDQDAVLDAAFRQLPLDSDGNLTKDHAPNELRSQWDIWDWDHNGLIDLEKYKAYAKARLAGWTPQKGGINPYLPKWVDQEKRPEIYRKSNLPTYLPFWFEELARHDEAQVYLYDWRAAGKPDSVFFAMDRNGDGILTVEEVLYYMNTVMAGSTASLLVQPGAGAVTELGADGKPRWTLSGLSHPRDVQPLSNGVVLIAEQNQVTERNQTGRVGWRYPVDNPLTVQRLHNGHTLIACPDRLLEVDRAGKEFINVPMPGIVAARRVSDDRIVAFDRRNVIQLDGTGQVQRSTPVNCGGGGSNEVTDNGHVLAVSPGNGNIIEFDADGVEIGRFNYSGANNGFRLPNGHTLVTHESGKEYLELDEKWRLIKTTPLETPALKVKRRWDTEKTASPVPLAPRKAGKAG